jgi:uncharacterized membrane protein (DUF485 family)
VHDERRPGEGDLTPLTGSATDVAPVGRSATKPAHERTADEDVDVVDWDKLASTAEFKTLLAAKARFIVPATVFFIAYYFALPLLVGYAPKLMATKVLGVVNLAYLFALSQFVMAWLLAWAYVRAAARFDELARGAVQPFVKGESR